MDHFQRTLLKTVIWRMIATVITFIVTYTLTGEFGQATTITLVSATLLMIGYYIHERVWDQLEWGRKQHALVTQNAKSRRVRRVVR